MHIISYAKLNNSTYVDHYILSIFARWLCNYLFFILNAKTLSYFSWHDTAFFKNKMVRDYDSRQC